MVTTGQEKFREKLLFLDGKLSVFMLTWSRQGDFILRVLQGLDIMMSDEMVCEDCFLQKIFFRREMVLLIASHPMVLLSALNLASSIVQNNATLPCKIRNCQIVIFWSR